MFFALSIFKMHTSHAAFCHRWYCQWSYIIVITTVKWAIICYTHHLLYICHNVPSFIFFNGELTIDNGEWGIDNEGSFSYRKTTELILFCQRQNTSILNSQFSIPNSQLVVIVSLILSNNFFLHLPLTKFIQLSQLSALLPMLNIEAGNLASYPWQFCATILFISLPITIFHSYFCNKHCSYYV